MEFKGQLHFPIVRFTGNNPGTHSIECWLGPTAFPHCKEKILFLLPGFETRGI